MTTNANMVFCRGCGQSIHISATACPQCGATQGKTFTMAFGMAGAEKSRVTAGLLGILLGGLGLHKFYTGAWGWGIVYIVLCWTLVPGIVALVEGIRYLTLSDEEFQRKAAQLSGPFDFLW